jgi:predicted acetyltransferase
MGIELRTATTDDAPAMFRADGTAFGFTYDEADIPLLLGIMDLGRFLLAIDDGRIVGITGSYGFEVTMPGGATLPAAGVTWVSVQATHRRQGLLRRMFEVQHRDIDDRGEPVAMLTASEASIYERFGYGVASYWRQATVDRRQATIRPSLRPAPGSVRYVDHDAALDHVTGLWDRYRQTRAGEISRSRAWQQLLLHRRRTGSGGQSEGFHLRHDDGYASYRVTTVTTDGMAANEVEVAELVACTPDAHLALWTTILDLDLVGPISTRKLALDDPLPYLVMNSRAVRTQWFTDYLWVCPRDPAVAFGARTYGTTDRLVVEAEGQRWAIDGSPEAATCRKVRTRPDLTTTTAGFGALLLGGVRPSVLAAGRRLEARDAAALRRADAFFAGDHLPFCSTGF